MGARREHPHPYPQHQRAIVDRGRPFGGHDLSPALRNTDYGSRPHAISEETLRRWRAECRGPEIQEARRLERLDGENRRVKRVAADLARDNSLLNDLVGRTW